MFKPISLLDRFLQKWKKKKNSIGLTSLLILEFMIMKLIH